MVGFPPLGRGREKNDETAPGPDPKEGDENNPPRRPGAPVEQADTMDTTTTSRPQPVDLIDASAELVEAMFLHLLPVLEWSANGLYSSIIPYIAESGRVGGGYVGRDRGVLRFFGHLWGVCGGRFA